jgi:hypothetical protein
MLAVLAMTSVATAAEDGFKISGDFAASYFYEGAHGTNSGVGTGAANDLNNNKFSLDMAELNIEKTLGNSGINIGIAYGNWANTFNSVIDATTSPGVKPTLNVTNTYFWHKVGDTGITAKLGKFETGIGNETYNYMDNLNYTRSYGFSLQPIFLTGLNVMYSQTMWDVGVTVGNSINNTDYDENNNRMVQIAAAVRPMEGLAVNVNYLFGKNGAVGVTQTDYALINGVVSYKWNMMNFALDYTSVSNEAVIGTGKVDDSSIALYAGYGMDNWGAGLRYEMASHDPDGSAAATAATNMTGAQDEDIDAITVSGYYDIDQNARVKAEIGMQKGEDASFLDKEGKADDAANFYGVALMYRF